MADTMPGVVPSNPSELARVEDRISFVYLEHAVIARDANALTATTEDGVVHIPSAALLVLMLGPGTNVTHQAMAVIADSGTSVVWVGERGVRYYAGGRPLARSTKLLVKQARIVSNNRERMKVAREMYAMRFPNEDVSGLTMQQLRGREGARVRNVYRDWSKKTGVEWGRRDYNPEDFAGGDPINQALSAANVCLYGLVQAAVVAIGCSPGLGIVHTGHDRSFVYDIADLYKAETSIPVSFEATAEYQGSLTGDPKLDALANRDFGGDVRRRMRDSFMNDRLTKRVVRDVVRLLNIGEVDLVYDGEGENLLWDASGEVEGGVSFNEDARG
ncbi:MAG: type I-E CRISPR-associated endonuclease Cas1e [Scrofimicrobium sp.]